jgi:hypothetical protein
MMLTMKIGFTVNNLFTPLLCPCHFHSIHILFLNAAASSKFDVKDFVRWKIFASKQIMMLTKTSGLNFDEAILIRPT